jgi:hypothetical protein
MAEVCARLHPKDIGEAIGMARQRNSRQWSCSASTGEIVALYDYACPNNGGLTSIAQEAIGSVRVDIGAAIVHPPN